MIQKLREVMNAEPFRAFVVALADGRRFDVSSPDMIWMPAGDCGGLHFFVPEHDRIISVHPKLIFSVERVASGAPKIH
ncbi:MAG: hypothetical protein M3463_18005 [Verrucomicrobiota bacterium]|nr:hypothetical protein [Verrucomicrobiota bacterium]